MDDKFKELQGKLMKFMEENKLNYISTIQDWTEITIRKNWDGKITIENKPINRY